MRLGIISDIHGNLPALEAVLERLSALKVDRVCCLGDTVGYGPFPNECVALVRTQSHVVLKGNHDSGLTGETPIDDFNQYGVKAIRWTAKVITPDHMDYLKTLPYAVAEEDVFFAHASPQKPENWTYILNFRTARENFAAFTTSVCFIGHTHVPVVIGEDGTVNKFEAGKRHIINVGSVGQPRDGNPDAAFGVYDTAEKFYQLVRVPYDIQRTAQAISEAGLPDFLAKRLFQGI